LADKLIALQFDFCEIIIRKIVLLSDMAKKEIDFAVANQFFVFGTGINMFFTFRELLYLIIIFEL